MTPIDPMSGAMTPTEGYIRYQAGFLFQLTEPGIYRIPADLWTNDSKYVKSPDESFEKIVIVKNIITSFMELTVDGVLLSKAGFAWNGVSGPIPDTDKNHRGGQVHDAVCRLIRYRDLPLSARYAADEILRRVWIEDGVWPWLANSEIRVMQMATSSYVQPSSEEYVKTAP